MNTLNQFDHYMIDVETLGLGPKAKILSLGVVHFDPLALLESFCIKRELYVEPDISAQLDRTADTLTVTWWESQPEELVPRGESDPRIVCQDLLGFIESGDRPPMIWAQGSDFDIPKLESFYSDYFSDKFPWKYNSKRDLRTLIQVCQCVEWPENTQKHNALADAKSQARMVWRCMNFLNGRGIFL